MAIDPRLLRSFVVLAEELHFSRAAERLNLAQSGLSQQIRRLETQVGCQLYARNSRVVELTDAGRAMLDPARAALRAAQQAERAAREAASGTTAHPLKVGISFGLNDLVPAVAAFASEHLDVELWVSRMYDAQGHEMLRASRLDAFVGLLEAPSGATTAQRRAIDVPLFALAGHRHILAAHASAPLNVYRESPIAMIARDYAPAVFDYCVGVFSEGQGRQALSIREFRPSGTGSNADIFEAVAAGYAVGFGTAATLAARADHLRLVPFEPLVSLPTYVSWQTNGSAVIDALAEHLSAVH